MQRKLQNEGRMEVHVLYKEFTDRSAAASGMVWYLETLLKFVSTLISVDREENWKGHLQVIQDMRPVFLSSILLSLSTNDTKKSPKNTPTYIKCSWNESQKNLQVSLMLLHLTWNWIRAVQEDRRWYHWSNETERFCEWQLVYHRFLISVKAAVTSQDQFWQRQIQQYSTRNCERKTWRSFMKQWNKFLMF